MRFFISFIFFTLLFSQCKPKNTFQSSENLLSDAQNLVFTKNENQYHITAGQQTFEFRRDDIPFTKIILTQTAIIGYLNELNALNHIVGVTAPNFIYHPEIGKKIAQNEIFNIGNENELDVETILTLKPDLIISSSNPTYTKYLELLSKNGIKILIIDDYKETSPLGRAEYLKIIGALIGKESEANQKYENIKTSYLATKAKIAEIPAQKHSTLVNTIYGDVWYLPAKTSLQNQLLTDAKANYLWKDTDGDLPLNLSFEEVYAKAKSATHWLNASDFKNLSQMKAARSQYEWFDAYKTKKVYNIGLKSNEFGGNDYYETGVARPDLILKDLGKIFYPEHFTAHEFVFYQKLE